jgi:predicted transcriptional regulator
MDERVRADLACLVDSPYRGPLLLELRNGTTSRAELREAVGASRATISRALSAFEERGWVIRTGQAYELTRLGRLVAGEFENLLATMETAHDLRGIVEYLPVDEFGFDIRHLRDATVVRPSRSDPLAPIRHADRLLEDATLAVLLSRAFSPGVIEALAERARAGEETEVVVTTSVVESLGADDTLREQVRSCLESDAVEIYEHDGEVPYILAIADAVVSFGVQDDDGRVVGVVDVEDEVVLAWARATFGEHRENTQRLDPDRFSREGRR